jgi:hypothetical protein
VGGLFVEGFLFTLLFADALPHRRKALEMKVTSCNNLPSQTIDVIVNPINPVNPDSKP